MSYYLIGFTATKIKPKYSVGYQRLIRALSYADAVNKIKAIKNTIWIPGSATAFENLTIE